jgi:hypothetical protein
MMDGNHDRVLGHHDLDHLRLPFQWTKMTEQQGRRDSD